mmetsp:Transcript_10175/g.39607  ORF Transcript_10175/g.39607 Transcript_10175/m.39607 type:complete len:83 (+) Transcript_10175:332-580(+)
MPSSSGATPTTTEAIREPFWEPFACPILREGRLRAALPVPADDCLSAGWVVRLFGCGLQHSWRCAAAPHSADFPMVLNSVHI